MAVELGGGVWPRFVDRTVLGAARDRALGVLVAPADGAAHDAQVTVRAMLLERATVPNVTVLTYPELVMMHGPIRYWRLGEASGSVAVDEVGNGNGTYVGPTKPVTGLLTGDSNTAADFDGSNDYVSFAKSTDVLMLGQAPFSAEAWVDLDALPSGNDQTRMIVGVFFSRSGGSSEDGWRLIAIEGSGNGKFRFHLERTAYTSSAGALTGSDYALNTRYHVVATYDGATIRIYVNGVEAASGGSAVSIPNDAQNRGMIGSTETSGTLGDTYGRWNGVIDEVAIYDRALNPEEIALHHEAGVNGFVEV